MMGLSACLEVISGWKRKGGCFFSGECRDLCHQRVVPQGKKQQGRKGKGLWVILSPGIRGVRTVDNKRGIGCLFAVGVKTRTCVSDFLFVFVSAAVTIVEVNFHFQTAECEKAPSRDCFWRMKMVLWGAECYHFQLLPNTDAGVWTWRRTRRVSGFTALLWVFLSISFSVSLF